MERGNTYAKKRQTSLQNRLYGGAAWRFRVACAGFALVVLVVCTGSIFDICWLVRVKKILIIIVEGQYESKGNLSAKIYSDYAEKAFSLKRN